jgi:hypothetical protein
VEALKKITGAWVEDGAVCETLSLKRFQRWLLME